MSQQPARHSGEDHGERLPWYRITSARLTVLAIVGMSLFSIIGVVWGTMNPKQVEVRYLDAGPESAFAIGKVVPFPDLNVYVIGMEDGRLRAVDGIVRDSRCVVEYRPDDHRGSVRNPRGVPGVFVDPCSGAVWAANADVISGADRPLRVFTVSGVPGADGVRHVRVEVIGDRHPTPAR